MLCYRCRAEISSAAEMCVHCGADLGYPPQRTLLRTLAKSVIDATPAGKLLRRAVGRETLYGRRNRIARKYLRGSGIEFGALDAPVALPRSVEVRYADVGDAKANYEKAGTPDIVADIETMDCIKDRSLDFVVANHVLEHVENPLRAFEMIHRVLRPGGIAFITLPDKRFSFDRKRPLTPLDHLIADYENGPKGSLAAHYDDYVENAFGLAGTERQIMVDQFLARHANIHFHVWDFEAMAMMFTYVASRFGFSIIHSELNGKSEGLWILRRSAS
jgi:SAM-dependent methyltransferase